LWNKEFAEGHWDFIENAKGDAIYEYLVRYAKNGSILDLGCGTGSTGCELDGTVYRLYTGIDISDVAVEKANARSKAANRADKNNFFHADITEYVPDQFYDVILFRESIYYIPRSKLKFVLQRYAKYLKSDGVLIIKWFDFEQGEKALKYAKDGFRIHEKSAKASGPLVAVLKRH